MFAQPEFPDHELLDSGGGEKLERLGGVLLRRPDPQALWRPRLDEGAWGRADLRFERDPESGGKRGRWIPGPRAKGFLRGEEPAWVMRWRGLPFHVRPTPFKHVGVFPEQAANWAWVEHLGARLGEGGAVPRLLNLFGYTGLASLVARRAGFEVTHVDASKASLDWMSENRRLAEVPEAGLRVILEDALLFAERERRRGKRYDGILLDPPHHGRGPKGERWQLESGLAPLLDAASALLSERSFLVLSTYAVGFSPLAFENMLGEWPGGEVRTGELAISEVEREGVGRRHLPCGFCARWSRGLPLDWSEA